MKNQRYKYYRHEFKNISEKPECDCGFSRVLQCSTADVPFKNAVGGRIAICERFMWVCCGCGNIFGYVDNSTSPEDIIRAMEKPDLSAKYEEVLTNA